MENIHDITLNDAVTMTTAWREQNPDSLLGGSFDKESVELILNQEGCVSLKYYYALNNGAMTIVLVGVNAEGEDMYEGQLAEYSLPCPPTCRASPLNDLG